VSAFDGYQREIPVARFEDHDVILALTRDGEPLPKGAYLWEIAAVEETGRTVLGVRAARAAVVSRLGQPAPPGS